MKVRYLASTVHVPFFIWCTHPLSNTEYFSEVIILMKTTSYREVSTLKTFQFTQTNNDKQSEIRPMLQRNKKSKLNTSVWKGLADNS